MPRCVSSLVEEVSGAWFGDERLGKRLQKIVTALARNPTESLPTALRTTAALEATYRFMSNPRVTPHRILEPHFGATCQRVTEAGRALVIHDTTEFSFGGKSRASVGRTNSSEPGYFAHLALCVAATDRRPLGVLGLDISTRNGRVLPRKIRRSHRYRVRPDRASLRWKRLVAETHARVGDDVQLIHVMDREGDQFDLFAQILDAKGHFVIRAMHDRPLLSDGKQFHTLWEAAEAAQVVLVREVRLSPRTPRHGLQSNPAREGRRAELAISAGPVAVKGPKMRDAVEASLDVNIVRVIETHPPAGEDPVEWVLITSLPVQTEAEIAFVVDGYRARWLVEELFKAVKTGCSYEKLQLESLESLTNALALVLPIAWQMLLLRHMAHTPDNTPASRLLTDIQVAILRTECPGLPSRPTAREAFLAIAGLGGHIKNNGEPGWLVIYRGFRDLMMLERGWQLKCDQS